MDRNRILASVYDKSVDGQLLLQEDGRVIDCNPAALKLMGCSSPSELIGLRPKDFSPQRQPDGATSEDLITMSRKQVADEGAACFEWIHTRMDGTPLHVDVMMTGVELDGEHYLHIHWRDISRRHAAEEALAYSYQLESLITSFSSRFINLSLDKINEGIELALGELARFVGADRSYVFSYHDGCISNQYEWCAEGIEPQIERMQNIPVDALQWSNDLILGGQILNLPSLDELPDEAGAEKAEFAAQGNQSMLVVPMERGDSVVGFVGFDAVRNRCEWPQEIIDLLRIAAGMIANILDRYKAELELVEINATLEQRISERTQELDERTRVSEGLRETLAVVNSNLSLKNTLIHIATQARDLSGASASVVYSIDLDNQSGRKEVSVGMGEDKQDLYTMDLDSTPGRELLNVVSQRQPLGMNYDLAWIDEILNDPDTEPEIREKRAEIVRRYRAVMAVPLIVRDEPYGSILLYYDEPQVFTDQQKLIVSSLAEQAALAIENARLVQSEQERRCEAEQRQRIAEGLREGLAALNSTSSLEEILDFVVRQAVRLLETGGGALYLLDHEDSMLHVSASSGLSETYTTLPLPVGGAITGRAVELGDPVSVPDLDVSTELLKGYLRHPDLSPRWVEALEELKQQYNAILSVPVQAHGEVYGAITLYYPDSQQFSDEVIELAVAFAGQAALVIENVRLRERVRETAAVEERSRLARDLHDAVTQTLFSASLMADTLPELLELDLSHAQQQLLQLGKMTRGALAEMRTLLIELRPGRLIEADMETLLQQLIEAAQGRTRINISLNISGTCTLPPDVKVVFYRIAQEGLNNMVKHARAENAFISMRCSSNQNILQIMDDGRGFDAGEIPAGHFGVQIMRERAEQVGAALVIDSSPGEGTEIQLVWSEE